MIDRLREWLLPALGLMILAALWTVANAGAVEDDVTRGLPPAPPSMMEKALHPND